MKISAIIPVKTFSKAKTRLGLPADKKEKLCKIMFEEILHTLSISDKIDKIVVVSKDKEALKMSEKVNAIQIIDEAESGVNNAVELADRYLAKNGFDASIVFPQDIPYLKTQDIEFLLKFQTPPNFVIVVPSQRFDGTNALVRMPADLMKTHYDQDSYRNHMETAKKHTANVATVFVKRIMWDVDNIEDLKFLLEQNEKPNVTEKILQLLNS